MAYTLVGTASRFRVFAAEDRERVRLAANTVAATSHADPAGKAAALTLS